MPEGAPVLAWLGVAALLVAAGLEWGAGGLALAGLAVLAWDLLAFVLGRR